MPAKVAIMRYMTKPGSGVTMVREPPERVRAIVWMSSSEPFPSSTAADSGIPITRRRVSASRRAAGSG